jgi:hypothetical protein
MVACVAFVALRTKLADKEGSLTIGAITMFVLTVSGAGVWLTCVRSDKTMEMALCICGTVFSGIGFFVIALALTDEKTRYKHQRLVILNHATIPTFWH